MVASNKESKGRSVKGRVLQARIPEQLDDELKGQAEQLGTSVSTVVRNILLNTFNLVEGVVSDSAQLARVIQEKKSAQDMGLAETPGDSKADSHEVGASADLCIGWQPAVLNRNGVCESCNAILAKGTQAAIGIPVRSRPLLMCLECLEALQQGEDESSEE